jgi:hypothetical protein
MECKYCNCDRSDSDELIHDIITHKGRHCWKCKKPVETVGDGSLAGKLLAFIKTNHQRGTFRNITDVELYEALKPFEAGLECKYCDNPHYDGM